MPRSSDAAQRLQARDDQQRELARTLHGGAAQHLAALQFNLEVLAKSAGDLPPRAARALAECASLASQCALEIRRVCYRLHPPLLDEMGLVPALRGLADSHRVDAELPELFPRLPPQIEIALFRIIEEAWPRISRLRLNWRAKSVTLEMDLPSVPDAIRERVRAMHGRIAANRRSLRITLRVPPASPTPKKRS